MKRLSEQDMQLHCCRVYLALLHYEKRHDHRVMLQRFAAGARLRLLVMKITARQRSLF